MIIYITSQGVRLFPLPELTIDSSHPSSLVVFDANLPHAGTASSLFETLPAASFGLELGDEPCFDCTITPSLGIPFVFDILVAPEAHMAQQHDGGMTATRYELDIFEDDTCAFGFNFSLTVMDTFTFHNGRYCYDATFELDMYPGGLESLFPRGYVDEADAFGPDDVGEGFAAGLTEYSIVRWDDEERVRQGFLEAQSTDLKRATTAEVRLRRIFFQRDDGHFSSVCGASGRAVVAWTPLLERDALRDVDDPPRPAHRYFIYDYLFS